METLGTDTAPAKKGPPTFLAHVFSTTEEGKAELLNMVQYALVATIPVVCLNKTVQRLIPEADGDKPSIEIVVEILLQIIILFVGIVVIHRITTFVPTYSGFPYEGVALISVVVGFLVIVLSIQTKMGIKVNVLCERLEDLWNGSDRHSREEEAAQQRTQRHAPSRADTVDGGFLQPGVFPPAPAPTTKPADPYGNFRDGFGNPEPAAANGVLGGGAFGSAF